MNSLDARTPEKRRLDFVEIHGLLILEAIRDCRNTQEKRVKEYVDLAEKSTTKDLKQVYLDLISEEMRKLNRYTQLRTEFEDFWAKPTTSAKQKTTTKKDE
jgi:rubrerythrin